MLAKQIIEKYPLTKEVMKDWFLQKMISSFNDNNIDGPFKDYMIKMGVDDIQVEKVIDDSPRMLLDLFDVNDIYISIIHTIYGFKYIINGNESKFFEDRFLTEKEAILKGIIILEDKLKQSEEKIDNKDLEL
jgi:hypothetical protein